MIRPYGDRILVERLDGHGVDTVSAGGIHLPGVEWKRGSTKNVADYFRARVLGVGSKVTDPIAEGDEVLVYTYSSEGHGRALVGWDTAYGLIVQASDILCVVEPKVSPLLADLWRNEMTGMAVRAIRHTAVHSDAMAWDVARGAVELGASTDAVLAELNRAKA